MSFPQMNIKREEDDEADEEIYEGSYKSQKDAVLFAIDVSKSMLAVPPPPATKSRSADRDSTVSAALRCAYQIMQQRIIAQPKDLMGVLFFGTDKSKFPGREDEGDSQDEAKEADDISQTAIYPHCYLFMDLDVPAAEDVRALRELVEEGGDHDGVLTPAANGETVSMANVLFCANQIFTMNAANFGSRRLFIITDNDNPHPDDKAARSAAAVRAKDLYDLGVNIELFPVSREDTKFDLSNFYDDIIYRDPAAEEASSGRVVTAKSGNGLSLLASLISNISAKQTPKRSYFSNLTFEIAPGLDISVKGYILLRRQKPARTCYVWVGGSEAKLATNETIRVDPDSTRAVETEEIKKAYKFGGEFVYFTPEELKALRTWEFPEGWKGKGLRIIGFKPRIMIPPWASVKRSTFIYPSEEDYVGSTRVFSALWQKLKKADKVGIAWFLPRTNASPVLVAIIPSDGPEREDESEDKAGGVGKSYTANPMQLPAGLWLYPLPFAEDIRKFDDSRQPPPRPEATEVMKTVVENLFLPKTAYNPIKYPNPALQWHYKILQAEALGDDAPTPSDDATVPKYKAIDKRVGGSLSEIKRMLEEAAGHLLTMRAIKREADDDGSGAVTKPLSKRPKTAAAGGQEKVTPDDLRKLIADDRLVKLTVAGLKDLLQSRGLSTSGKKADLVERIEEWAEENL